MRSLETFNKGLVALHSRGSIMSLNELSEEELDSRIKAGFQRVTQNLARCTASTLYDL